MRTSTDPFTTYNEKTADKRQLQTLMGVFRMQIAFGGRPYIFIFAREGHQVCKNICKTVAKKQIMVYDNIEKY